MTATVPIDARDLAFDALLPLAEATERAIERIQAALDTERKLVGPLRERINVGQRATIDGQARFSYGVVDCGDEWRTCSTVRQVSTPSQEASGIYLWLVNDRFMLRLKSDPVQPKVDAGALRLTAELPPAGQLVQVYLTWEIGLDGRIRDVAFACLEEPAWTILLGELLAHLSPVTPTPPIKRRGAIVKSARPAEDQAERDES
jgi:hypothetical protein